MLEKALNSSQELKDDLNRLGITAYVHAYYSTLTVTFKTRQDMNLYKLLGEHKEEEAWKPNGYYHLKFYYGIRAVFGFYLEYGTDTLIEYFDRLFDRLIAGKK